MELRKVQKTSGGTFFVCLPKEWAERVRLNKGSTISVSESADGRLVLDAKYGVEHAPQVAVVKPSAFLNREIVGKYLLGYDIIRIEAKDKISHEDREQVKLASSRLIGLEIVEDDYARIVMKTLLEPSAFPPGEILRREYSIAAGMHHDAVSSFVDGDIHLAKNVTARDDEVNRLYFLLVRILRTVIQNPSLSENLGILPIDCLDYRLTASLVESIGDQSVQIAGKTMRLKEEKLTKEVSNVILKFHKLAFEAHETALMALFTRDVTLAESVRNMRENVTAVFHEAESVASAQPVDVAPHILAVASLTSRIYESSVDIADLVMPRTVLF
jgi:phosphate uptake regulator